VKNLLIVLCLVTYNTGFCQEWNTDLETAKQKSATTHKPILLVFSGPDWCENCTYLDETVWNTPEFAVEAEKSWVLLRADFKQKKGMPEPFNVNEMKVILAEKYNRDGFFPFIVLLDQNGRKLGKTGYENYDSAAQYISLFKSLGR
jgi:thioredoxin-related protein